MEQEIIFSPVTGMAVPMEEVPDPVFANNVIGHGIAVIPYESAVVAPCDGEITVVTPTNHAFCIKNDAGLELLIHLGINTVTLRGKGFTRYVEKGQRVQKGERLFEYDIELCVKNGINPISPCIVTNGEEFPLCLPHLGAVKAGETPILTCAQEE